MQILEAASAFPEYTEYNESMKVKTYVQFR